MSAPHDLRRMQQWLQAVITHPAGVAAGVSSPDAQASLGVSMAELDGIVTRSATLTADARLAIYSHSYHGRLLECFRAQYPVLLHALGADLFEQFAIAYLDRHRPASYTLHDLAAAFPTFLAETRPEAAASTGPRESWPDFVVDLAALERAFLEVYDGPGLEGEAAAPLPVGAVPGPELARMRLAASPALRIMTFRYPVPAYFAAVRRGGSPPRPEPADVHHALSRVDFVVRLTELSAPQYAFLARLAEGRPVDEALAAATGSAGAEATPALEVVRSWLRSWDRLGFFRSVRP